MTHPKQTLTPGQAAREAYERTIVLGRMRETNKLAWEAAAAAAIEAAKQSGDLVSRSDLGYCELDKGCVCARCKGLAP